MCQQNNEKDGTASYLQKVSLILLFSHHQISVLRRQSRRNLYCLFSHINCLDVTLKFAEKNIGISTIYTYRKSILCKKAFLYIQVQGQIHRGGTGRAW